jgi:hypothetical protein
MIAYISTRNGPASFSSMGSNCRNHTEGHNPKAGVYHRRRRRQGRSLKSWLLVPVVLVVTYERSLAGRGFSLADSGLYQDVVEEGCMRRMLQQLELAKNPRSLFETHACRSCRIMKYVCFDTDRFFGLIFS